MSKMEMTDAQIVGMAKQGGQAYQNAAKYMYQENFEMIARKRHDFQKCMSLDEHKSVYADAILLLFQKIESEDFKLESSGSLRGLLFTIFFRKSVDVCRRSTNSKVLKVVSEENTLENIFDGSENIETQIILGETDAAYKNCLQKALARVETSENKDNEAEINCSLLLKMRYADDLSYEEIALLCNFNDASHARVRVFNCKEKVKKLMTTFCPHFF